MVCHATCSPHTRRFYRVLGKGAFGSVYAAHRLDTGKMYAIKAFQKRRLIRQDSLKLVFNERNYLERVSNPVRHTPYHAILMGV